MIGLLLLDTEFPKDHSHCYIKPKAVLLGGKITDLLR